MPSIPPSGMNPSSFDSDAGDHRFVSLDESATRTRRVEPHRVVRGHRADGEVEASLDEDEHHDDGADGHRRVRPGQDRKDDGVDDANVIDRIIER